MKSVTEGNREHIKQDSRNTLIFITPLNVSVTLYFNFYSLKFIFNI